MENIPLELSRYVGKSEEDLFLSSKDSHSLHNNILTPDKIPEFCLPPRLCKTSPLKAPDTTTPYLPIRVHLVSIEDLWDDADKRPLNCAVSLCLTPGKRKRQKSATIRNCHSPVFNEDFFFSDLSQEDLLQLELRIKVMDKPAAGTLRRGTVMGVISKPLSQLILL
ncbi:hypothetical protein LDENG_00089740 [Lucifuga dentata]|nr:hypothetical protein LDENG_00089740 [Lucifuga dentata]